MMRFILIAILVLIVLRILVRLRQSTPADREIRPLGRRDRPEHLLPEDTTGAHEIESRPQEKSDERNPPPSGG